MDRDEERRQRISQFLDWDNDKEIASDAVQICEALAKKDPTNATVLMSRIAHVAQQAILKIKSESIDNWNAMERAVQLLRFPKDHNPSDYIVQTTPIVKSLFPDADCEVPWGSQITKDFFYEWLENLKQCPMMVSENWASRMGYRKYFERALELDNERKSDEGIQS